MSYVISVGGDPINPNPYNYSQVSLTASQTFIWPNTGETSSYVATNWVDITANAGGYIATMPPANQNGTGAEVVINNYGSYTITINNAAGGGITTVASGETKRIWITDNTTSAGTWRVANIGSGTTSADASMLAGYGLIAQAGQLSQSMQVVEYSTDAVLNAGVRSYLAKWTSGVGTFTLDDPATLGNNWFVAVNNAGSGILTIDGDGANIDSEATIAVSPNQGFIIGTDGVNFSTLGRFVPDTTSFTLLSKAVGGNTNVTLTSSEAAYSIIYFTGVLTGNISVIVPSAVNEWVMFNNTTGAYTLTVRTSAGTGVAITQATRRILNSDGTDVYFSDNVGTGSVTSVATGTGLTGGPITTSGTISIANTSVIAGIYGGAMGVHSNTVNAQGQITSASFTARSITGTANEISVADGDGVSGPPTISLPSSIDLTGKTITGGTLNAAGGTFTGNVTNSQNINSEVLFSAINANNGGSATSGFLATNTNSPVTAKFIVDNGLSQLGTTTNHTLNIITNNATVASFYGNGNFSVGSAALATTATAGFAWITSSAGPPTGAASSPYANAAAIHYDSTNNQIYIRCGGVWRKTAALT